MKQQDAIIDFTTAMTDKKSQLHDTVKYYFKPNAILTSPFSKELEINGLLDNFTSWTYGFPDLETLHREVQIFPNRVVSRWTIKGKQTNQFFGINPTNRQVLLTDLAVWEFNSEGMIQGLNYQLDIVDLMKQLGHYITPEMHPKQKIIKNQ